jgi:hypothetical protein
MGPDLLAEIVDRLVDFLGSVERFIHSAPQLPHEG